MGVWAALGGRKNPQKGGGFAPNLFELFLGLPRSSRHKKSRIFPLSLAPSTSQKPPPCEGRRKAESKAESTADAILQAILRMDGKLDLLISGAAVAARAADAGVAACDGAHGLFANAADADSPGGVVSLRA